MSIHCPHRKRKYALAGTSGQMEMCYRKVISGWLLMWWRLEGHLEQWRALVWVQTWGAFPVHWGTWTSLKQIQNSSYYTIHANPKQLWLQWSFLGSQQSKMQFILCLTRAVPCVRPACSPWITLPWGGTTTCLPGKQHHAAHHLLCYSRPGSGARSGYRAACPAGHQCLPVHGASVLLQLILGAGWDTASATTRQIGESLVTKADEGCKRVCRAGTGVWDASLCRLETLALKIT